MLEENLLSEEQLARTLAKQHHLEYKNLSNVRIDSELFERIPVKLMYRYQFIPERKSDGMLLLYLTNPTDLKSRDDLELLLGEPFEIVVTTPSAIQTTLRKSEAAAQVLREIGQDLRPENQQEDAASIISDDRVSEDGNPIVKLVNSLILNAIAKRASDIHLEATEASLIVKYRIDGVLYPAIEPLGAQHHAPVISRIKILSELDIAERRIPQDGSFRLKVNHHLIDFRVSVLPGLFGEDIVIRILDKEALSTEFEELRLDRLGMPKADLRKFRKGIRAPYGMVLVTGPTGSGKTTTLYAAISEIHTGEEKIVTIEDPIEYQLQGAVQIPVNEKKGLSFSKGLRSILRHDPDKILVGEIRDPETAHIAIQAALTGHLVFTTVHANNAFDVIGRFINMGIEPYNFVSSLNLVLAQRLVRAICSSCSVAFTLTPELAEESGLHFEEYRNQPFYIGKGCLECNQTGYRGRSAITEILDLTDPIKEMILSRKPASEIQKMALASGMKTLRQNGLEKVFSGITTLKELNRITFVDS